MLAGVQGNVDAKAFQDAGCIVGVNNASFEVSKGEMLVVMGLSGSGKSTLAVDLVRYLKTHQENVLMLDGDDLREILGTEKDEPTNYTRPKRLEVAMRYSRLCRMISAQGFNVVIATMSLFNEVHKWNRTYINNYTLKFVLIFNPFFYCNNTIVTTKTERV